MAKQMTNQKHGLVSFLYPFLFFVCDYLFILNFMYDFLDSIVNRCLHCLSALLKGLP